MVSNIAHSGPFDEEKPLAIDLFCGLGGWAEGFLRENYRVVGFDIECHVYGEHRYPAQLVIQHVITLHGSQFRDAAVIVASPPCQFFSYTAMPWSRAKTLAKTVRDDPELLAKELALFNTCFRIQHEACEAAGRRIPLIVENVRGAENWVKQSRYNFGSFYLWGDVPALMPVTLGRQAMKAGVAHRSNGATNFHGHKNSGGSWFGVLPTGKPNASPQNARDVMVDGLKVGGSWFGAGNDCSPMRQHSSKSSARKAASAMIAKIPLPLSRHIAKVYYPRNAP